MPEFTRLSSSVRAPTADDHDPDRLVLPSKAVLDSSAPTHSAFRLPFQKLQRASPQAQQQQQQQAQQAQQAGGDTSGGDGHAPGIATIRLANAASGRIKEVTVKPGPKQLQLVKAGEHAVALGYRTHSRRPSVSSDNADVDDVSVTDITDLINSQTALSFSAPLSAVDGVPDSLDGFEYDDPRLCEAVLRAIYSPKAHDENLDDLMHDADTIRHLYRGLEGPVYAGVHSRAQKVAQYRRAEAAARLEKIQHDDDPFIYPAMFDDPQHYETWKADEIREMSKLINLLGTLPAFSASVKVEVMSGDNFCPSTVSCHTRFGCGKAPQHLQVYCSVSVLPTKPGNLPLTDSESDDGAAGRTPAFLTDVVTCVDTAEWHSTSPWIPINSMQDRLVIEVWDKLDAPTLGLGQDTDLALSSFTKSSFKEYIKRKSSRTSKRRRKKVAPWSGDAFLGQVVLSFSHIEAQALAQGGVQGKGPVTNHLLSDDKGRQTGTTVTLQIACICEHFYRDGPPNKALLLPPVDDIERAYDILVRLAYDQHKEGEYELNSQWKRILHNFAAHYGVRKERCRLGIVHVLAGMFNTDGHYLSFLVQEWSPVCLAAKEGRLTKTELAVHSNIVALLVKPAVEVIENFQAAFPKNQPPGALSKLIVLISLILRWDLSLHEIAVPLKSWIQTSCEKRFHKYLVNDSLYSGELTEISSKAIVKTIRFIRNDISEHGTTYVEAFPHECYLPSITAPAYYKLVSSYVKSFLGAASVKTFPQAYVDLANELVHLHEDIEKLGVNLSFLDVHALFKEHLWQWLSSTRPRMIDWISSSVSAEKWEPLSPQTSAFFSFSLVDLYFMLGEVGEEMSSRLLSLPFGMAYLQQVEVAICTAIETYVGVLEKLCVEELPEELPADNRGVLSYFKSHNKAPRLSLSKKLCVKLNDIHGVLEQQLDLEKRLSSKWDDLFRPSSEDSKRGSDSELNFSELDESVAGESSVDDDVFGAINAHLDIKAQVGQKFKDLHHYVQQGFTNAIGSIVENIQSHLASELQYVLYDHSSHANCGLEERFRPLTEYLDKHLSVMNQWLHPVVFRYILQEIAHALMFCMEEFALNRDEDPNPMTSDQRVKMGESLTFFYDYFYGGGLGLTSKEMDEATARLRRILESWDLDTQKVCTLYWQAWDKYNNLENQNAPTGPGQLAVVASSNGHPATNRAASEDAELHVLDYLWLLRQKDDEEAQDIVMHQSLIANNKMMQFVFGLPKDEEMVHSFSCRNSMRCQGTLYITPRHVCFADASMAAADDRKLFKLPLDRVLRVDVVSKNTISVVPLNNRPYKFTKIGDCDAVCRVLFKQVVGTGTALEKYMASAWSSQENSLSVQAALKEYHCCKHQILSKKPGTLKVLPARLVFVQSDHEKSIQIEHSNIASIHSGRRGLRASGVVVELKPGNHIEFVDFTDPKLLPEDVVKELNKLVFGGTMRKTVSSATKGPDETQIAA